MKRSIFHFLAVAACLAVGSPAFAQQTPVPPPPAPAAEADPEVRRLVEALKRLKISGYIQAQYVDDASSADEISGGRTANRDQFSVRRGRIKLVYQATPTARGTVAFDAASGGVTLKDAFVELIEPWTSWRHTLTAGQFSWPFGHEVQYSSSNREMPERARVIRELFPGERDRGVMGSGRGLGERFQYQVAIVNGTGTSQSFDWNAGKDLVGRATWTFPADLTLGASLYRGEDLAATAGRPAGEDFDKDRTGVEIQWRTPLPGFSLRGEAVEGTQLGADVDGWYLYLIQDLGTRHQLVLRGDSYDPNADVDGNAIMTVGGAYHFHWDKQTKLTLAYEHPERQDLDPDDDVLTARVQFKF